MGESDLEGEGGMNLKFHLERTDLEKDHWRRCQSRATVMFSAGLSSHLGTVGGSTGSLRFPWLTRIIRSLIERTFSDIWRAILSSSGNYDASSLLGGSNNGRPQLPLIQSGGGMHAARGQLIIDNDGAECLEKSEQTVAALPPNRKKEGQRDPIACPVWPYLHLTIDNHVSCLLWKIF